ncbi:guanylate kinase [Persicirhabdus sediminis]|uniref:Guanylate kinase n=1 Tax=Persicirhabdus sediminis TaxID=454144 RepID=A0A8J7MG52_9BACT|nr:guanylate kinase [Persicirhabdus sediminis]MBK1791194.1 guanylate kinase [Persicirhabdus sediminis]
MSHKRSGILLLVSGPSGSGKSTLCRRLTEEGEAVYSTSCTTRQPREGEQDGVDYFFQTRESFKKLVEEDKFIEYAEVHGNNYGTLISEVVEHLEKGTDVVLDIDVQGASLVRECQSEIIQQALVDVFVMPPSEEELYKRLSGRGTDAQEIIDLRMKNSVEEMQYWNKYTSLIYSGTHEEDYAKFKSLLIAERLKVSRLIQA